MANKSFLNSSLVSDGSDVGRLEFELLSNRFERVSFSEFLAGKSIIFWRENRNFGAKIQIFWREIQNFGAK
jgi:hypothetical protein